MVEAIKTIINVSKCRCVCVCVWYACMRMRCVSIIYLHPAAGTITITTHWRCALIHKSTRKLVGMLAHTCTHTCTWTLVRASDHTITIYRESLQLHWRAQSTTLTHIHTLHMYVCGIAKLALDLKVDNSSRSASSTHTRVCGNLFCRFDVNLKCSACNHNAITLIQNMKCVQKHDKILIYSQSKPAHSFSSSIHIHPNLFTF